jgi:glutamate-5-semialdehyde dehydrogenase
MDIHKTILAMADRAVTAAHAMVMLNTNEKNAMLNGMANELDIQRTKIKAANTQDMETGAQSGLSSAMLDRLELTDKRIDSMIEGIRNIISLTDPVKKIISTQTRPNGLEINKVRVPIGVIGIIYESRPNVTSGNLAITDALRSGGKKEGLPDDAIQLVSIPDRDAVREIVQMEGRIDLIIPRGGESLIRTVTELARIPVLKHYKGVCHTFVDNSADIDSSLDICENAKCQRPGVCNAMETLLVHEKIAGEFLPKLAQRLQPHGVELRGDKKSRDILHNIKKATEEDWYTEYLDLVLSIRVVPSLKAAIEHINKYGSHHSDAIITKLESSKEAFELGVDSATVYTNASTRFTDGGEFGMGAEIGISTDKLHARGPVGLEELTTYKFIIRGKGQIRT